MKDMSKAAGEATINIRTVKKPNLKKDGDKG
jgi:hypothetical protein